MTLIARDLSVAPPGAPDPVVRGFSMEVAAGEWVALSGANGSGKTSLALTLAGLWPAVEGDVTLEGEPIARARERGAVAAVLQEPMSQLLEPTVADELAFTARNLSAPDDAIADDMRLWARPATRPDRSGPGRAPHAPGRRRGRRPSRPRLAGSRARKAAAGCERGLGGAMGDPGLG
ncbi:MAG: ATP-binding cassette domain-containing protein [Candidatus Eisenbacteria bacterium]|uniref:ATP-binding cassette domain-containing protein n=1 Tax=Eiseniibacteriota bacterium TaxID=2212470 RepID=A0A538SWD4_UNCEI|nr:MAG: ATP-binding cassette domain-containing protein [Candidatus Eisenbacteria bacterium]